LIGYSVRSNDTKGIAGCQYLSYRASGIAVLQGFVEQDYEVIWLVTYAVGGGSAGEPAKALLVFIATAPIGDD